MPFFDQYFFGGKCRALQNIGGVANVTITGRREPVMAFDTGPGNCLIDCAVRKISQGRMKFDDQGKIA
ncbi:MAG: anhydro-N-acetylmuramic acid kinase, partial [Candidatus Omnitrophica bacterium]|nr:anhydro-N-acetylmuramic acid kinase [Candidatus Omnitrophota bacterium]